MIIYRKEPYHLQMRNIMLLDDVSTGGVVYVNKATYDQALLLYGRFDGNSQRVLDTIKGKGTEVYVFNKPLQTLVEKACKEMPEPLNMIAPFLIYATPNQGIDWENAGLEFAYGILHQLSQLIDFNATTLVPKEVRAQITIPTVILMQYQTSWDELCSTLKDKVVTVTGTVIAEEEPKAVVKKEESKPVMKKEEPVEEDDDDGEDDGIDWDALNARLQAIKDEPAKTTPVVATAPTPAPTPVVTSTPTPAPSDAKESASVLDEFDV